MLSLTVPYILFFAIMLLAFFLPLWLVVRWLGTKTGKVRVREWVKEKARQATGRPEPLSDEHASFIVPILIQIWKCWLYVMLILAVLFLLVFGVMLLLYGALHR